EVNPRIKLDPKLLPFPYVQPGSKYAFIAVNSGVSPNSEGWVVPVEDLNKPEVPWRKIADFDDEVKSFALNNDDLYLLTYKNAPRYKIIKTSLQNLDLSKAKTIIEPGEAVLTDITASRDALYVQQNDGGAGKILRVDYKTEKVERLNLSYDGAISDLTADPREPGINFAMESWVKPKTIFVYDAMQKAFTDT